MLNIIIIIIHLQFITTNHVRLLYFLLFIKNSYGDLKQNQIIFSAYNSLEERRYYLPKKKFLKCKIKKENKKYTLTIPVSFGKINQINFDLIEEEKDIKNDNNKKKIYLTKELLNNLNNEINFFQAGR